MEWMTLSIRKVLLLLLPLLLPLVFIPAFPTEYELPKLIFFVISIQVLLILSIRRVYNHITLLAHDRVLIIAGLFVLILLITNSVGLDPHISLLGSISRHQGFIMIITLFEYIVLMRIYAVEKAFLSKNIMILIYTLTLLLSGIALGQFIMHTFLHISIPIYNDRIVATMGNPNFLGGVLTIGLLLVLFCYRFNSKLLSKILFILFQTIVILALLTTRSQSAILGLLLGYGIYAQLRINNAYKKVLIYLLVTLTFIFTVNSIRLDFSIWDNQLRIWPVAIQKITENPLLGYGQENFQLIYPEELLYAVDSAHNLLLEIALAGGIPALIFFTLLIFLSFKNHTPEMRSLLIVALFLAQFNPISVTQHVLIWFIFGLTPVQNNLKGKQKVESLNNPSSP